jgi:hypothetical protein
MSGSLNFSANITLVYDGTTLKQDETTIADRPIRLNNTSDAMKIVYLNFTAPVPLEEDNLRFVLDSPNITIDGMNNIINLSASDYLGLVQNSDSPETAHENIVVQNVKIVSTGTLATEGGWICAKFFKNCTMINCLTKGVIVNGGGCFGTDCFNCTARNCISYCSLTDGGGIFGNWCNNCTAISCNSTGLLIAAGGIFGNACVNCTAEKCYSTGAIMDAGGGIFGADTNADSNNKISSAIKCYSTGKIGASGQSNCGGIFGAMSNYTATSCICQAESCFSLGEIFGSDDESNGGIFGNYSNQNATLSLAKTKYCFSMGSIGNNCGGIFGVGIRVMAEDCYSHGAIGPNGGGIVGCNADLGVVSNCYSRGDIGDSAGGIYGSGSENSTATSCYSVGIGDDNSGGIFGANSISPTITRCFTISANLVGADTTGLTTTESAVNLDGWDTEIAKLTVYNSDHWIEVAPYKAFLLVQPEPFNVPTGYAYSYVIQDNPTVANGTNTDMKLLTGYYTDEQISDSAIDSGFIYGYGITTQTFMVLASGELVEPINSAVGSVSFDQLKSFQPIWTCESEKL